MAKTYEEILDEMCKRVKECSTMEGSFICTALAPFAMELALLYLQLEEDEKNGLADTSDYEHLKRLALDRGIIPNAVLHKDYQIPEPITIRITKEKIEITSFPVFDRSIIDQSIKQNIYISRCYKNKRIAEILRDLNLIEAKNTGIPKAIRAMQNNSSPKLLFETNKERDYLTVVIPINKMWGENYKQLESSLNDDLKQRFKSY